MRLGNRPIAKRYVNRPPAKRVQVRDVRKEVNTINKSKSLNLLQNILLPYTSIEILELAEGPSRSLRP